MTVEVRPLLFELFENVLVSQLIFVFQFLAYGIDLKQWVRWSYWVISWSMKYGKQICVGKRK